MPDAEPMSTPLAAGGTPFLYLAAVALLAWATSRFVRPLSWTAALVLALLPLTFTGKALLTGGVYAPIDMAYRSEPFAALRESVGLTDEDYSRTRYDTAFRLIPWRKATRYAIKHGEWPIWNPFILSGDILAAAAEPAVYHPIHLVSHLLPLGSSLTFVAALFFFAAGLCSFCYSREIGCGEIPAAVGAAGWMFSNFMLFWMGWPLTLTIAFFPLLMLAARRSARAPGPRSMLLLTVAFVLVVLAGHPESALHCVAVAAIYGLVESIAAGRRSSRVAIGRATIGWSLLAGALALLICAVYLLPLVEALFQSQEYSLRRNQVGSVRSVSWALALERLRTVVVPFVYGMPWSERIEVSKFAAVGSAYAGSVLLAPAVYGWWRSRWRGRWLMLCCVVLGTLAYVAAPGLTDLLARLPLFDITINRRLVFVAAFGSTTLAVLGCEAWLREPPSRRLGWLSLGVLLAVALAIGLCWSAMVDGGLPSEFLRSRTLLELVPLALATVLLLAVPPARLGLAGLLVILLAQRWMQMAELNPTYPQRVFFPPVKELQVLPRGGEPYRIAGQGASFPPNLSTLYELEDVRGATPITNRRLFQIYRRLIGDMTRRIVDLERPLLSFLNVRYSIVDADAPIPEGWRTFLRGSGYAILENPAALERAFVPGRVRLGQTRQQTLREMEAVTDFSRLAWIEERGPEPRHPAGEHANASGRVTGVESRGLGLRLTVELERAGWVLVSETAWRGWRATTEGREIPVHFGNHAFLALYLPAGRRSVDLVYRPHSFVVGRAVSLATAGALATLLLGSALRRRRPVSGEEAARGRRNPSRSCPSTLFRRP